MEKKLLISVFLFLLLLVACTNETEDKLVYKSKPEISVTPWDIGIDSLHIRGYKECLLLKNFKGLLPEIVAVGFNLQDTYVYSTYGVMVDFTYDDNKFLAGQGPTSLMGYDSEFRNRAIVFSSGETKIRTYLIYLKQNMKGESIERWLPVSPDDLEWNLLVIDRNLTK